MKRATIHQYANEVCSFSSQYGGEKSLAYVTANIIGPASVYPSYGDVTHACVFRTYGPWWDMVPSSIKKFSKCQQNFNGQDFIDVKLETPVIPEKIKIYETYNPQPVIQIYCAMVPYSTNSEYNDVRWYELWSQDPEVESRHEAIIFEPNIKHVPIAINVLRLIIYSKHLAYYAELDAIEVIGSVEDDNGTDLDEEYIKKLQTLNFSDEADDSNAMPVQSKSVNNFATLPRELISLIFSKLDFIDLCRAARTCTLFRDHCYDSLLLLELDLQPYWHMVTSQLLESLRLTARVSQIQKLSVSWCAFGNNKKFAAELTKLIADCGTDLQVLRIQGCSFALDNILLQVAANCEHLLELNLSSSLNANNSYICISHLSSLTSLDLYRSSIDDNSLTEIIQANPGLQHLNVGNVITIQDFDLIASSLGKYCKNLKSLNFWRAKGLTAEGVDYFSQNCHQLEELDIGWCSHIQAQSQCFITLVQSCQKLKKLFLTSIRTTRDSDIEAIASHCNDLEQFDILGTNYVSPSSVERLLSRCQKLVFLDVSFCKQISDEDVQVWRSRFPDVSIKKSHTTR
ncbi:F-box/LRR-repeat protein 4-like isoform X2 [Apostichopus japonicus]